MPEAHKENAKNIAIDAFQARGSAQACAARKGTKTSMFFSHWCIRSARGSARRVDDVGGNSRSTFVSCRARRAVLAEALTSNAPAARCQMGKSAG